MSNNIDGLFIQPNEVVQTESIIVGALITGSAKSLKFSLPIGKFMNNVNNATIQSLVGGFRSVNGGYVDGGSDSTEWVGQSEISFTVNLEKISNTVSITIVNANGHTGVNNNQTISGLVKVRLKFT